LTVKAKELNLDHLKHFNPIALKGERKSFCYKPLSSKQLIESPHQSPFKALKDK